MTSPPQPSDNVEAKVRAVLHAVTHYHEQALDIVCLSILPGVFIGDGSDGLAKSLIHDIDVSLEWAELFRCNPLQALQDQGGRGYGGDLTRAAEFEAERWEETADSFTRRLVGMWQAA